MIWIWETPPQRSHFRYVWEVRGVANSWHCIVLMKYTRTCMYIGNVKIVHHDCLHKKPIVASVCEYITIFLCTLFVSVFLYSAIWHCELRAICNVCIISSTFILVRFLISEDISPQTRDSFCILLQLIFVFQFERWLLPIHHFVTLLFHPLWITDPRISKPPCRPTDRSYSSWNVCC